MTKLKVVEDLDSKPRPKDPLGNEDHQPAGTPDTLLATVALIPDLLPNFIRTLPFHVSTHVL